MGDDIVNPIARRGSWIPRPFTKVFFTWRLVTNRDTTTIVTFFMVFFIEMLRIGNLQPLILNRTNWCV